MRNLRTDPQRGGGFRAALVASALMGAIAVFLVAPVVSSASPGRQEATSFAVVYAVAALCGGLALASHQALRLRVSLALFACGHLFWFALPALGIAFREEWYGDRIDVVVLPADVVFTAWCVTAFGLVAVGVYFAAWRVLQRQPRFRHSESAPLDTKKMVAIVATLTAVGFMPFLVFGESLQGVVSGILGSRGAAKEWAQVAFTSNPIYVIGRGALVTAAGLAGVMALRIRRRRTRLMLGSVFAIGFVVTYFDSGTRSWTALVLVPPVLVALRAGILRGHGRRWMLLAPVLGLGILGIAQVQVMIRDSGGAEALSELRTIALWDNDFFSETAVAVSLVPERFDYLRESPEWLFLTNPVPRAWWSSKPYPRVVQIYGIGRRGYDEFLNTGRSSMPSVVGQYYMSWGVAGVVWIAVIFGVLMAWFDLLWARRSGAGLAHFWVATGAVWLFLSFRLFVPGFHYAVVISGLVLWYAGRGQLARSYARVPVRT